MPVFVFEPTLPRSACGIEKTVQRNLRTRFKDRTILVITHRADAMLAADHLVLVQNGRVIAQGRPDDLLSRQDIMPEAGHEPASVIALAGRRHGEHRGR